MATIAEIFTEAQRSVASHAKSKRCVDRLLEPGRGGSRADALAAVLAAVLDCVDRTLVVSRHEAIVDRVAAFIVLLAASYPDSLLCPLLDHLVSRVDAKSTPVRQRSCRLIADIMEALPPTAELPNAFFERATAALLARSRDRLATVRALAARALTRMQNDEDAAADPVLRQLSWLLAHDDSGDVRAAALCAVQLNADTLPMVIDHCRDVAPAVRVAAVRKLGMLVDGRLLTPATRSGLLCTVLTDPSPEVGRAATEMLARWAASEAFSLGGLLSCLDTTQPAGERAAEAALYALFALAEAPAPKGPAAHALLPLWEGVRGAIAEFSRAEGARQLNCDDVLFMRVRGAWLARHGALGAGAGRASSLPPALLAEAADALLPGVEAWASLFASVCFALGAQVTPPTTTAAAAGGSAAPGEGACPSAAACGLPSPSALARDARWSSAPEPDAIAMGRQLLLLGQLLDFSDEASRRTAVSVLAQAAAQPCLPRELVPLAVHTLAVAMGAGGPVEGAGRPADPAPPPPSSCTPFLEAAAAVVASLLAAAAAAEAAGGGGSASSPAGAGDPAPGGAARRLRSLVEMLRQTLEDAQDGPEEPERLAALQAQLAAAEDELAALEESSACDVSCFSSWEGGGAGGGGGEGCEEGVARTPEEAAGALRLRAMDVLGTLLGGGAAAAAPHAAAAALEAAMAALCPQAPASAPAAAAALPFPSLRAALLDPTLAAAASPSSSSSAASPLSPAPRSPSGSGLAGQQQQQASPPASAAAAARLAACLILGAPRVSGGAELAGRYVPVLTRISSTPSAVGGAEARAAALSALGEVLLVFRGTGPGALLAGDWPLDLFLGCLGPSDLLPHDGLGPASAPPCFPVQMAAARCLVQAVLSGAIPASTSSPPASASSAPGEPGPSAPLIRVLSALHAAYYAAVWVAAAGEFSALEAATAAGEAAAPGDEPAAAAAASALASAWSPERASSFIHTVGQALGTVAALSHTHRACLLVAARGSCRAMGQASRRLDAGVAAAGGRAVAAFGAGGGGTGAGGAARRGGAADGDDEEEEEDSSEGEGGRDAGQVPSGAPRPGPRSTASAAGPRGGRAGGARSVVTVSSNFSSGGGGAGGGAGGATPGARWVSMALLHAASLSAVVPVFPALAASGAADDAAASAVLQAAWYGGFSDAAPPPSPDDFLASSWLLDAAAEVTVFAPVGAPSLLPVLLPALARLAPDPASPTLPDRLGALLHAVTHVQRSASGDRAVRKLAAQWGVAPLPSGTSAAAAALSAPGGLVAARVAELAAAAQVALLSRVRGAGAPGTSRKGAAVLSRVPVAVAATGAAGSRAAAAAMMEAAGGGGAASAAPAARRSARTGGPSATPRKPVSYAEVDSPADAMELE